MDFLKVLLLCAYVFPTVFAVNQQLLEVPKVATGVGPKRAITPEVSAYAEELLKKHGTPGLSVGVVQLDGDNVITEFGSWGNRTDDGLKVSKEVGASPFFVGCTYLEINTIPYRPCL